MKQDFQFNMNRLSVNKDQEEICVTQSKNGIMINPNVNAKNQLIVVNFYQYYNNFG